MSDEGKPETPSSNKQGLKCFLLSLTDNSGFIVLSLNASILYNGCVSDKGTSSYFTMSAAQKSLPEMRTEAASLLASGTEHLEDGNYTDAVADLGSASELFAKVRFLHALLFCALLSHIL